MENVARATARDLLAHAIHAVEAKGVAGRHVHNELIIEVPKNSVTVEQVTTAMWEAPR